MRALIIGTSSVLGQAVTEQLLSSGHEVRVAGRTSQLRLDLREGELPEWAQTERFDVVLNFAGLITAEVAQNADDFENSDTDMVSVNTAGPVFAARIARATGSKQLVHLSTWYAGHVEQYRGDPRYPVTKRRGEDLLAAAEGGSGLTLTILRPTHVYDDLGRCRSMQPALYWLVDEALEGRFPQLPEPELRRDYLHLDDLCAATLAAVGSGAIGTFVLQSPATRSFAELAASARDAVSVVAAHAETPQADGTVPTLTAKPAEFPGYRATIPIEEGLRRIVESAMRRRASVGGGGSQP